MIQFETLQQYKKVPNQENGTCFACGQDHATGLRMNFFTDDSSVFSEILVPSRFAGWSQIVHGGITATILDETLAWTVIYLRQSFILTKSLTIEYLRPIFVDKPLYAIGSISEVVSERELLVDAAIYDSEKELCAKARGSVVMFSAEQMKKKKLFPEVFLNQFESSVFGK
ncbi:PaaI family thioesterase [Leptospira ognonensis]|uniref:PaaI family thioesterase n=1 Tax=Leptospira ognonensis TaxID=2484945 RepID=A0A4R9K0C5_9LEPT|nr:PaaI family thioesterase [Leptospira ognonensis]TGL58128.1 PaaI family thioesterase [Leptospira ognonensis]